MDGTNHATDGLRRITRRGPWWNVRLAVFALMVGLVALLLVEIQSNVASRMANLGSKFGNLTAESFYVGVDMRGRLRRQNEHVLNYKLTQHPAEQEAFVKEATTNKHWLAEMGRVLSLHPGHTAEERKLFDQIQPAYGRYLAAAKPLFEADAAGAEPAAFVGCYQTVREKTAPLLVLTDQFVRAQQRAFDGFLEDSRKTLGALHRLLNLSEALLLASTLALAVLIYRGMIAPMRRELTESQAIIERQEKLASLGTLAAGVAHEIRNPLTAIKFRLFSLKKSLPSEFADHEDTGVITAELNRLERIVKDFLQFARPSEPELVRLPAQRLLEEVRELLHAELEKAAIQLQLETAPEIWIQADTHQIKQVLINLIQNAADSIGCNGTITLGVRSGAASLGGRSRSVSVLAVADTGPGIPPEVEKRLFDPFFTTKEGGTGLGLPIAARIVTAHGGLLRYRTQLNRGTVFEIVLPRIEDEDHAPATPDH
jgi:signal transduction histidine kinase